MNWDAMGAVAELAASVGVIFSLIYLARQIRGQTVESKLAGGDELARQINNAYQILSDNERFATLYLNGMKDYDALSGVERVQVSAWLGRVMRVCESAYYRDTWGRIDPTLWEGLSAGIQDLAGYPGFKTWWRTREHWYSENFRTFVARHVENSESPPLYGEDRENSRLI